MKKLYTTAILLFMCFIANHKSYAQCPYPTPVVNVTNGVICNGSPAILSVPDVYDTYQWYWGNVPVPVAANNYSYWAVVQGNYSLEVALNGCTTLTAPVFVSAPGAQPLNFPDTIYSCDAQLTVQLDTNLYDSFLWSSGEQTSALTLTQSGWIGVGVGISSLACGVADTFYVELNKPAPTVSINTIGDNPFCVNSSVIFESSNATGNTWSSGETSQSIVVTSPGTYSVTVENYFGCTATASVVATEIVCLPTSNLIPAFCPNYNLVRTSAIICVAVASATQYEWRFIQNGNVYATKFTPFNYLALHTVSPIINWNNIFQVQVRPFVNGQWGAFGNVCDIGIIPQPIPGTVPPTQLRTEDCGRLNYRLNNSNRLVANAVYQAIAYEFQFTNILTGNVVGTKVVQNPICFLNTVTPTLPFPAQYNLRVRAFYGGIWGNYGNPCLIGIIGLNKEENTIESEELSALPDEYLFEVGAYPNPFENGAILSVLSSETEKVNVRVFDISGKLLEEFSANANDNKEFGKTYQAGMYFLKITSSNGSTKNIRVIKR
jgi:hypothetical protein